MEHAKLSLCLAGALLALPAEAKLPWGSQITQPALKSTDSVSFDPLSLLAILWNPRATASAGRLYMQPDLANFRWPHLLQIGAVLTPVSMLVTHLTSNYGSTHPAVDMCAQTIDMLDVTTSIGASKNLFSKLPVTNSDLKLLEVINFRPSHLPTNYVMIVLVQNSASPIIFQLSHWKVLLATKTILWTEIVMGIMALSGTVFSSLLGDLWAVVLFASYLVFWVASTAISFRQLNLPDSSIAIKADEKTVFAIHQRPVGGLVIFKGRQDVLERWQHNSDCVPQLPTLGLDVDRERCCSCLRGLHGEHGRALATRFPRHASLRVGRRTLAHCPRPPAPNVIHCLA